MPYDDDRRLILERRALFLSLALCPLACASTPARQKNLPLDQTSVTATPDPEESASPAPIPPASTADAGDVVLPTYPENEKPPLEIPEGEKFWFTKTYRRLFADLTAVYERLDAADALIAKCGKKDCAAHNAEIGQALQDAENVSRRFAHLCPVSPRFDALWRAHLDYIALREQKIRERLPRPSVIGPLVCLTVQCESYD